jgi:regulator of replication initiation timing
MLRVYLIILILHLGFVFQGCASLKYLDGSSEAEIRKFKMTKDEMWNEMQGLKIENAKLQEQINILREEDQGIRDEDENKMARMRDQNESFNEQINSLKEENQRLSDENQDLRKELTKLQLRYERGKFMIKVLSGDGDLNSAMEMAKKLRNMGYNIKLIDYAPRSNFLRNIVFFSPKFQKKGKQLVFRIGGNTVSKPLIWYSIFDLIVVTGKSP